MKCPKCKYSTFDFVDTCPKCGKNLASEKGKLNMLSVKPNPPFVLSSLIGDSDELGKGPAISRSRHSAGDMKLEGNEIYDDGSELDINIDEAIGSESDESVDLDLGDLESSDDADDLAVEFSAGNTVPHQQPALRSDERAHVAGEGGGDLAGGELELDFDKDEDSAK